MIPVIIFCSTLVAQALVYVWSFNEQRQKMFDYIDKKEAEWTKERQQLLDRIQSPSFAEYKHQEVKVIKANNNVPEPQKLEVM